MDLFKKIKAEIKDIFDDDDDKKKKEEKKDETKPAEVKPTEGKFNSRTIVAVAFSA